MTAIERKTHDLPAARHARTAIASSLAVAIALAACAGKPPDPSVAFSAAGFTLQLPPDMQRAADSLVPGFRAVRTDKFRSDVPQLAAADAGTMQPMFAVVRDLDGDGTIDAVEEGTVPGDSALHVVAIMNGKRPKAMDIVQYPLWDADAVGLYLSLPTGSAQGSFSVVNYPDSSTVYKYAGGHFTGTKVGG